MIVYTPFIFEGEYAPAPTIDALSSALNKNEARWLRAAIVNAEFSKAICSLCSFYLNSQDPDQILKSFQWMKALQLRRLLKDVISHLCQGDWQAQPQQVFNLQASTQITQVSTRIEREAFALLSSLYPAHHSLMKNPIDWAWQKVKAHPQEEIEIMLILWRIWPLEQPVQVWMPYLSYIIQSDPQWGHEIAQRLALYYRDDCLMMVESLAPMKAEDLAPFQETLEKHLRRIFAIKLWVYCREVIKRKILILFLCFVSLSALTSHVNTAFAQSDQIDDILSQIASPHEKEIYLIPNLKWLQPIQSLIHLSFLSSISQILEDPQLISLLEDQQSIVCLKDLKTEKFLIIFQASSQIKIDELLLKLSKHPALVDWQISQAFGRVVLKQSSVDPIEWFKNQWIVAEHEIFKDCPLKKGEADFFAVMPWLCLNLKLDPQHLKVMVKSIQIDRTFQSFPLIKSLQQIKQLSSIIQSDGLVSLSFHLADIATLSTWFQSKLLGYDSVWLSILERWQGEFHLQWGQAQEAFAVMLSINDDENRQPIKKNLDILALDKKYTLQIDQNDSFVTISHQKKMILKPVVQLNHQNQEEELLLQFEMKATDLPKSSQFYEDLLVHHLQIQPADVMGYRGYFDKIALFNQSWGDVLLRLSRIRGEILLELDVDRY